MIESKNENPQKNTSKDTPVLNNFSRDLIKLAEEGKLDPVIGREREITRIAQILSRRKKNNPIIVGDPGCVLENTIIEVEKFSNKNSHNIIILK
jgi:ATP-dependent Clp protease ATP-binding subunit ClpA